MSARASTGDVAAAATKVRAVTLADQPAWLAMRRRLWPAREAGEHEREMTRILDNRARETALLGVADDGTPLGFVEVSRRQFVDGCSSSPVGYVEGLYVEVEHRRRRVARDLVQAAASWAQARGCRELASNAGIDDATGQAVHERLGFEETARFVLYRQGLAPAVSIDGGGPASRSEAPAAAGAPGVLPASPPPAAGPAPWRPGPVNLAVFVLGALAFWFTDVFSDDLFYGAVLPIVDVLFVMYVIALIMVVKYRSKTGMGGSRGIYDPSGDS